MAYLSPRLVTAPQEHLELIDIVYDLGEEDSSVAFGKWDGQYCLLSRWNGSLDDERTKKGNPISHTYSTWFVLPSFIAQATMTELLMLHARGDARVNHEVLLRAIRALPPNSSLQPSSAAPVS